MNEQKLNTSEELKEEALEQVTGGERVYKEFRCTYNCSASFDTKEELRRHIHDEHTGYWVDI
jgi:hypothetical protein